MGKSKTITPEKRAKGIDIVVHVIHVFNVTVVYCALYSCSKTMR